MPDPSLRTQRRRLVSLGALLPVLLQACRSAPAGPAELGEIDASTGAGVLDASPPPTDDLRPAAGCITKLTIGGHHSCALRTDGTRFCWGSNNTAQLNDRTEVSSPSPRPILTEVVEVVSGSQHLCALRRAGGLWCWGRNEFGAMGILAPGSSGAAPSRRIRASRTRRRSRS